MPEELMGCWLFIFLPFPTTICAVQSLCILVRYSTLLTSIQYHTVHPQPGPPGCGRCLSPRYLYLPDLTLLLLLHYRVTHGADAWACVLKGLPFLIFLGCSTLSTLFATDYIYLTLPSAAAAASLSTTCRTSASVRHG